jgi:hypothetical protein
LAPTKWIKVAHYTSATKRLTKVHELIDPATGVWDEGLVHDTLWEVDANVVLKIPIREDFNDFVAWHYDDKGIFTVKSGYHLYMTVNYPNTPGVSGNGEALVQWKNIWDLPLVPKIKQFMWRLAHNCLPLKLNIKRRGIECNTMRVCCKRLDEDGAHLFLKCKEVKKVLNLIGMDNILDHMCAYSSAAAVVQEILSLKETDKILACCTLWRWWCSRNKVNSVGQVLSVQGTVKQARFWASESEQYCMRNQEGDRKSSNAIDRLQWCPPVGDVLKINTDGAFAAES